MAELRLQTTDLTTDIDLLDGVWKSLYGTYAPMASDDDVLSKLQSGETIQSLLPMVASASEDYTAAGQAISTALEIARQWKSSPLLSQPLWLRIRPKNQTTRRFLVLGGIFVEVSEPTADALEEVTAKRGNLLLYLHIGPPENNQARYKGHIPSILPHAGGYYHPGSVLTYTPGDTTGEDLPAWGGTLLIPGKGTRPARIDSLILSAPDSQTTRLKHIWIGIKPLLYETDGTSEFDPRIDFSTPTDTPYTSATTGTGDTASVETEVTYNSGEAAPMAVINWPDASVTDKRHFYGRYLVLLRYRIAFVSGTGDKGVRIKMMAGEDANDPKISDFIYLTGLAAHASNYFVVELGNFRYPFYGTGRFGLETPAPQQIVLWGNTLVSGTEVHVHFNRAIFVPWEIYAKFSTADVRYDSGEAASLFGILHTYPDDQREAVNYDTALTPVGNAKMEQSSPQFHLPIQGGVLTVVAAQADQLLLSTDTLNAGVKLFDRYSSWKGAG